MLKIALQDTGSERDDFIWEVMSRLAGLPVPQVVPALIGDGRGAGLFLRVELVRDRETLAPALKEAAYVVEALRRRGSCSAPTGRCKS